MSTIQFYGVFTALATPFSEGAVCLDSLQKLVQHQLDGGIEGLVSVGTTGESPTLSHAEHIEVVRATVAAAAGKVPVIAGTGSNSTDEAVELTRKAEAAGADGFLLVAPYYNKPSQEGLFLHFSRIAESTERPIVLYSIPSRCGIEISVETTARLYERYPHVCCMKAAEGSCDKVVQYVQTLGPEYAVLSGDDAMTLPFMSVGARGVISVASNLVVRPLVEMVRLARANDFEAAQALFLQHYNLFQTLFLEPNPVPVKHALRACGIIQSDSVRAPLCGLSAATREAVDRAIHELGLIQ